MDLALAVSALLVIAGVLWYVRKAGADGVKATLGEQNEKTAAKVADAVAAAPHDDAELSDRLLDPKRPL